MTLKRYLALFIAMILVVTMIPIVPSAAEEPFDPAESTIPIFEDAEHYTFEERAADLVARMSLSQKASQTISQGTSAITAAQLNTNGSGTFDVPATKGIKSYTYWSEALHGVGSASYPQNYTSASSWNRDLYYNQATEIGKMARELRGTNANNLTFFSPTVNMGRDPRWGRNEEAYGEDPYLTGEMGARFVMGMEGKNQDGSVIDPNGYLQAITTLKHYTANNSERNRLSGGAATSLQALREYYTASYRNVIKLADAQSVMTAYSSVNTEPSVSSSYLLDTLVRQTWGFSGYIVSDCDGVRTMVNLNYTNPRTGKVMTSNERLAHALAHGNDLECNGGYGSGDTYASAYSRLIDDNIQTDKGLFTENTYDVTVSRIMTDRLKLGEVDGNIKYVADAVARPGGVTAERANIAETMSTEGTVLLKNQNNLLPLNKLTGNVNIAIVNGHVNQNYLGLYTQGSPSVQVNITAGIQNALTQANPGATITFTNITSSTGTLTTANEDAIRNADYAIVVTGTNSSYSSEDGDRTSIKLPGNQPALIAAVGALNSKTVSYTETCGPIEVISFENNVGAILWSSFGGIRKTGPGNVIAGLANPSGKVTAIWHREINDTGNSDVPSIYDYDLFNVDSNGNEKVGRTYMYNKDNYTPGAVSYPFGFGLSYTDYVYSNLKITKKGETADVTTVSPDDEITVSFSVKNNGTMDGAEVAQLYIAPPTPAAGQIRPIKMLKGFEKKMIAAGQTETFSLDVKVGDLSFYNETTDKYEVDLGSYEIQVGPNSRDILANMKKALTVAGSWTIVPEVVTAKPCQTGDEKAGIEQRVIFAKGAQVFPQLTVSMNDESLHGYIIKDQKSVIHQAQKTDLIAEGFSIVYTDKHPEWNIVSITGTAPNQVITAANAGVTTITATVTKNGVSASTDFVVYVESDAQLVGIEVDGDLLDGFISTRQNYTVEVAKDAVNIPVVTPINFNNDLEVTVTPLTSLPGTTKINVTHKVSGKTTTYSVGFGYAPQSANFKADGASSVADTKQWELRNPTASGIAFTDDGLKIAASRGSFASTEYPPQDLYMQTAAGDSWVAQTKFTLGAAYAGAAGPQTGLVIFDNENSYIRFVYERTSASANALRVYNGTTQVNTASVSLTGSQLFLYLQVLYQRGVYSFRYSTNGTTWTTMATNVNAFYALPKLGVIANYNNTEAPATPFNATFEYLNIIKMLDVYPRLSNIKLGDAEIEGFSPEVFNYNVTIDDPFGHIIYDEVPEITAVLADPTHTVEITPPAKLPGIGTIVISSPNGFATYNISFNYLPRSTNMTDGTLDEFWSIYRENATSGANSRPWSIEQGKGLILPTQRYEPGRSADIENIFLMPASGNWEAVAKVHFPKAPNANYQQIAAVIWQDENSYIKFNHESNGGAQKTQAVAKTGGALNQNFVTFYGSLAPMNPDGSVTIYYKFKKEGNLYSCSFSSDGYEYDPPATIEFNMLDPKLGFFATSNSTSAVLQTHAEFICITEYYGLTDTQRDAAQYGFDQVVDYVEKDLNEFYSSAKVGDALTAPKVPHGYSVDLSSDNTNVVDNDGKVVGLGTATLSATVTMGKFTKVIEVDFDLPPAFAEMSEKDDVLSIDVTFNDSGSALLNSNVFAAVYNAKGQLVTVQTQPFSDDLSTFKLDVSGAGENYTAKVFVWDKTTFVPLYQAIIPTVVPSH